MAAVIKKSRVVIPLFLILVVDTMGFGLIIPLLKPMFLDPQLKIIPQSSINMAYFYYGLVLALYPLAICLGTPIIGMLSDRWGRKKMLLFSLYAVSLGLILCYIAVSSASIYLLILGRVITGLSSGSKALAQAIMVDISSARERAKYLSVIAIALTVGMVAGPLTGGIFSSSDIYSGFSLSTPFVVAAILSFLTAILFQFMVPETNVKQHRKSWSFKQNLNAGLQILKQKNIGILLILFILLELSWSLFFQSSAVILGLKFQYDSRMVGYFITFLGLSMGVGLSSIFQYLIKHMKLTKLIRSCFLLNLFGFSVIFLMDNSIGTWLGSVPMTIGVGMAYTAILALLSKNIAQSLQGWLMGTVGALLALAWSITGFVSGFLSHLWLNLPILLSLLMTVIALLIAWKTSFIAVKT